MLSKVISGNILKLAARSRRYASTCWCPEEPFDEFTRCTYMPNGVRVVTEENNSPLACVSLFVIAGPRYETSYNNGITHFIEHMAYKGFKSMDRARLEACVYEKGMRFNVITKKEMQIFSVLLPTPLVSLGIEYLYKIITDLDLSTQAIDQEKYPLCLELLDADNDPKAIVFEYLHASAFQGTPLAQPVMGSSSNLVRFDATMMSSYFTEHYTTCKLILATSGGVIHDSLITAIGDTFGCIKPSGGYEVDPGPCRYTASQVIYRNDDMPFAHVAIAFEAPGYNNPDYLTMYVMKCLMGSWHKSMGRPMNQPFSVAQNAGGADCCISYESFYIAYKDIGLWGAYFVADKMDLDDMVIFLQCAWMAMTVTCHSSECQRAVQYAKFKMAKKYEGVVNSSMDIGTQMVYACTRRSLSMIQSQLDAVKPFAIREAGEKYLYNKSPVVAAMGPTENLTDYSRIEGGMYWLRW